VDLITNFNEQNINHDLLDWRQKNWNSFCNFEIAISPESKKNTKNLRG